MQRQQNNIKMGLIKIGIRIIQSNTSFLLLKYIYIQCYMFQLRRAIHQASTEEHIHIWFCTIGIPTVYSVEVYCLQRIPQLENLDYAI
jgi:hypothetical protein